MNVLIVHAHPHSNSYNSALKELAVTTLQEQGHQVQVSDLYAMDFKAVGDSRDFIARANPDRFQYQEEQAHAVATGTLAPDIVAEQEKVLWADMIIFHFPIWWYSLPAILKGWVDRVFAYGFAYPGGFQHGKLKGRKAMLALTTGSTDEAYKPEVRNGDIDMLLFPIQHGMLYYVGMEVLPPFIAYAPAKAAPEQRAQYMDAYRERLLTLHETEPLHFPYPKP